MESKFYYKCVDCRKVVVSDEVVYLCHDCEKQNNASNPPRGVMRTLYDYKTIIAKYSRGNLFEKIKENNFFDLLPIKNKLSFPDLKVGKTPLYRLEKIDNKKLPFELYLKDDSQNPTYSFKDRASIMVSAFAKDRGIDTIIAASTGNAGSSLAGICAANKQKAIIFAPAKAPKAKLTQILMYGAKLIPVDGNYDMAFDFSIEATKHFGLYNRNTAYNPITIEGKKTVSYEIYSKLKQIVPDYVFVPVGDGVIISGVFKGFEDLYKLGIIDKMPIIVCVQSDKSKNIVANLKNEDFVSYPSSTLADSISVDIPRNFYMTKYFINKYNGQAILVSDEEIMQASYIVSKNYGLFSEPAAATATAGMLKYYKDNKIQTNSKVVVLLTGSGLKDLSSVQGIIDIPKPIKPSIESLKTIM